MSAVADVSRPAAAILRGSSPHLSQHSPDLHWRGSGDSDPSEPATLTVPVLDAPPMTAPGASPQQVEVGVLVHAGDMLPAVVDGDQVSRLLLDRASHDSNVALLVSAQQQARESDRANHMAQLVLGYMAIGTGTALALSNVATPSYALAQTLPGWPWLYGVCLALSGVAVVTCKLIGRQARLGVIGLYAMTIWYVWYAALFTGTWTVWFVAAEIMRVTASWAPSTQPALSPLFTFGGLAVLSGMQVFLLRRRAARLLFV